MGREAGADFAFQSGVFAAVCFKRSSEKLTGFSGCWDKPVQFSIDYLSITAVKKIADKYGFFLIIERPCALFAFLDM